MQPETTPTEQRECPTHGAYQSKNHYGKHWSMCGQCLTDAQERERVLQEQTDRQNRVDRLLTQAGLIGRYTRTTLDNFVATTPAQSKAVAACRDIPLDGWAPMWLVGPPGTGKTHLLAATARSVIEDTATPAAIVTAREMVARLRATWHKDSAESEADVLAALGRNSLLCIDEIGIGYGTDAELTQILDVVDARYRRELNVAIASNLPAKEIRVALGERLFDRLRENATVVPCDWASHRTAAKP